MPDGDVDIQEYQQAVKEAHGAKLLDVLNADRKSGQVLCDGKLCCKGKKYLVHKCVLSSFSDYFKTMFRAEMRERYDDAVVLDHISHDRLGVILDYLYTGYVKITDDNVFTLLEDAEYAQIEELKRLCSEHLLEMITVENCLRVRAYSKRYNLAEAMEKCNLTFTDDFMSLFNHKDFGNLEVDDIAAIIKDEKRECSEYDMFTGIVRWVQEDLASREELFADLFSLIDLSKISDELLNEVRVEELVRNSIQCSNRLIDSLGERILLPPSESNRNPSGSIVEEFDGIITQPSFVIIGGRTNSYESVIYDTKTHQRRSLPNLKHPRYAGAAVTVGEKLLAIGGSSFHTFFTASHKQVELLDLTRPDSWQTLQNLNEPRRAFAATVINDSVYVCGGRSYSTYYSSCERYDVSADKWTNILDMVKRRAYHAALQLNGSLCCIGGHDGKSALSSCESYDLAKDSWTKFADMNDPREGLAAVVLEGKIYAIGGFDGTRQIATVEAYDPETDKWTYVAPLNMVRSRHGACVVDGKIYAVGGLDDKSLPLKSVEVYDPVCEKWTVKFDIKKANLLLSLVAV